jgi:hypothetical protein
MSMLATALSVALMSAAAAPPPGGAPSPAPAPARGGDKVRIAELSPKAEQAIDRALRFMAGKQNRDGSWGREHAVAHTALTLMAFMVKGHFPDRPPHGDALARGIDFLLKAGRGGGGYMGDSMYEHGLATLALSEAWGMSTRGDEIRDALKRAVDVILRSQNKAGGWRYQPRPESADISITVMQILALASAKEAGILVPDETIKKAVAYVKSCQSSGGGFGYTDAGRPGFARTAAGVTSLLMCGERDTPAIEKGLEYLKANRREAGGWYMYGNYYAVQAMYQAGEGHYQQWYPTIRDELIGKQRADGGWGDDYQTPMAVLILGVPYRFLPIYQR